MELEQQKISEWYKLPVTRSFLEQLETIRLSIIEDLSNPEYLLRIKRPNATCAYLSGQLEVIRRIFSKEVFDNAENLDQREDADV